MMAETYSPHSSTEVKSRSDPEHTFQQCDCKCHSQICVEVSSIIGGVVDQAEGTVSGHYQLSSASNQVVDDISVLHVE